MFWAEGAPRVSPQSSGGRPLLCFGTHFTHSGLLGVCSSLLSDRKWAIIQTKSKNEKRIKPIDTHLKHAPITDYSSFFATLTQYIFQNLVNVSVRI